MIQTMGEAEHIDGCIIVKPHISLTVSNEVSAVCHVIIQRIEGQCYAATGREIVKNALVCHYPKRVFGILMHHADFLTHTDNRCFHAGIDIDAY